MISLLALDMDGTLLNSEKKIDPQSVEMLKAVRNAGITIALSTGRGLTELKDYMEEIRACVDCGVITSGAVVYDFRTDQVIWARRIGRETARKVYELGWQEDTMSVLMSIYETITDRAEVEHMEDFGMGAYKGMYRRYTKMVDEYRDYVLAHAEEAIKINFYHKDRESRDRTFHRMEELPVARTYQEETSLEVIPCGLSKAAGLEELCRYLGISMEETMVVGDSENDMEVLEVAGVAVAMGNALKEVKDICDICVADNDHGGIAEVCQYLLDQNKDRENDNSYIKDKE